MGPAFCEESYTLNSRLVILSLLEHLKHPSLLEEEKTSLVLYSGVMMLVLCLGSGESYAVRLGPGPSFTARSPGTGLFPASVSPSVKWS